MKLLALLISLTLLVATHELGHLAFAKLFHTRVRRYYIFFNPWFSLFKAKKFGGRWHFRFFNAKTPDSWNEENLAPADQDNTLWGIGWLPFGGYCDIAGMVDETKSSSDLESEPQPWEYRSKPAWQRLCIISGGVLVNFISALLIYGMIFAHWGTDELPLRNASLGYDYHQVLLDEGFQTGDIIYAIDGTEQYDFAEATRTLLLNNPRTVTLLRGDSLVELTLSGQLLERVNKERVKSLMVPRMPFVVRDCMQGSPAQRAGMLPGDSVVSIGSQPMAAFSDISPALSAAAGDSLTIGFVRNGQLDSLRVLIGSDGKLGVQFETDLSRLFAVKHIDYTFFEAIPAGVSHGWHTLVDYVSSLKALFAPGGVQNLGGFGTMASIFPERWDWLSFWNITALLALILAFMNIIPIPGLDGGHIVITLYEMITRRRPSDKLLDILQNIGMFLLLALLIIANGNDLLRALGLM